MGLIKAEWQVREQPTRKHLIFSGTHGMPETEETIASIYHDEQRRGPNQYIAYVSRDYSQSFPETFRTEKEAMRAIQEAVLKSLRAQVQAVSDLP